MVSIHAPHAGRDAGVSADHMGLAAFQSTRPMRGATVMRTLKENMTEFQSTRPVWGATLSCRSRSPRTPVSIHAPRVGRDSLPSFPTPRTRCFNPRAPCGARQDTP